MRRFGLTMILVIACALCAWAKARSYQEMMRVAQEELASTSVGSAMMKAKKSLRMLDDKQTLTVFGYDDGGFVVVAVDDMYPAVLGCSETKYNPDTDNPNFRWWMEAMTKIAGTARTQPLKIIRPNTDKYPASVSPLVKTKWDQDSPYNNLCPKGYPTGCVATAMAQVIKYNEWPICGEGTVYTYVPFGDFDGKKYEEYIGEKEYQYNLMLNDYFGAASRQQKTAVATLMYHVGLAMKAQYESTGTGSYNETLAHGGRNNLGYPYAVTVNREDYTEEEWMDMIFKSISDSLPIVYGGSDLTYMGHEFVLHGYNSQGKIYINWGWSGSEDGYFDLATLKVLWGIYDFRYYQNMLLRVDPKRVTTEMVEVSVETPGTLADVLTEEIRDTVVWLKVNGRINAADLKTLREMAGSDEMAKGTRGTLSVLDLSDASIVAGGGPYLLDGEEELLTNDDEMPYKAFYKCAFLIDVRLPRNLKHYADGVFAQCNNLDRVELIPCEESDFIVIGNQVLSKDSTEFIEQLPSEEVELVIPEGVTTVHPYAFASRFLYERLLIPKTVEKIGVYAFNRCFDLSRTYIYAEEPPQIESSAIDDLDLSLRYIYVPTGTRMKFQTAQGWKKYGNRIVEFDTSTTNVGKTTFLKPTKDDVYTIDGRLVRKAYEGTKGLRAGVYVVGNRKMIVR